MWRRISKSCSGFYFALNFVLRVKCRIFWLPEVLLLSQLQEPAAAITANVRNVSLFRKCNKFHNVLCFTVTFICKHLILLLD